MPRQTKSIDFSVPPTALHEVERIARAERRAGKTVFRDMVKAYKDWRDQCVSAEPWVTSLLREAKEEQKKHPLSSNEIAAQMKSFAQDFSHRAKARGITIKDIDRLIYNIRNT